MKQEHCVKFQLHSSPLSNTIETVHNELRGKRQKSTDKRVNER